MYKHLLFITDSTNIHIANNIGMHTKIVVDHDNVALIYNKTIVVTVTNNNKQMSVSDAKRVMDALHSTKLRTFDVPSFEQCTISETAGNWQPFVEYLQSARPWKVAEIAFGQILTLAIE